MRLVPLGHRIVSVEICSLKRGSRCIDGLSDGYRSGCCRASDYGLRQFVLLAGSGAILGQMVERVDCLAVGVHRIV